MSAEQLIAEFNALPWAERRQVVTAILANEGLQVPEETRLDKETAPQPTFSERWSGSFTLPEPDPGDARLTYLLNRFSV